MSFWKNLKSKLTEKAPESNKNTNRSTASPSPGGEGRGEGELNSFSSTSFDPDSTNRNGKIARLPRPLRERINRALCQRFPAVKIVSELNKMPEVKAVLAEHFGGRPILPQNISEWKSGGYRDWLHRQQILENKRELDADAKDLANTAPGMADSLFGMLTLDYAHLLINRDTEDPEQFEKKRKSLGILAQDIVRLRRCHLNARRVQVQETKLENDTEKTGEQLHFKFMSWAQNPAVRKALILAPMEADRQMRILHDLPPAPEDPLVERETRNDPYFGRSDETKTGIKPNPAKKSNPKSDPPPPPASEKTSGSNNDINHPTASPSPAPEQTQEDVVGPRSRAAESPTSTVQHFNDSTSASPIPSHPEGTPEPNPPIHSFTNPPIQPTNPYAGKTTQEIIEKCEDDYAGERARRLHRREASAQERGPTATHASPDTVKDSENPPTLHSGAAARELSPYDKALLEGKTFEEALYAQFAPVPKPKDERPEAALYPKPNPLDSCSEPVHYAPQPGPTRPLYGPCEPPLTLSTWYNLRPPPGFNSLG